MCRCTARVLARISKMPVQNSNSKRSAHPDLCTNLLQILCQLHFVAYCVKKGQFTFHSCPRRLFVWKIFGLPLIHPQRQNQKFFMGNFACPTLSKNYLVSKSQAGLSQDLETGWPQLAIVKTLGIQFFKETCNILR